MGLGKLSQ